MSTASAPTRSAPRSRPPSWLSEGLDLVEQRRRALLITAALVVVAATAVAAAAPDVLPRTLAVGAAVGVASLLVGLAVVVVLDAADQRVRGPRHVRSAGGDLVAVLPDGPATVATRELAAAIEGVRPPERTLMLGLAAATGDGRRAAIRAEALGRELARAGTSTLVVDLTGGGSSAPGFLDVVREGTPLGEVVERDPELRFARLGPGSDTRAALSALVEAGAWIPRDLGVLLIALPMAASRAVVRAGTVLDQVLILAERDQTSRVELLAGLNAFEAIGVEAQVVLVDDTFARHLGVAVPLDDELATAEPDGGSPPEPAAEPEPEPESEPEAEAEPVPEPEPEEAEPAAAAEPATETERPAEAQRELQGRDEPARTDDAPAAPSQPLEEDEDTLEVRPPRSSHPSDEDGELPRIIDTGERFPPTSAADLSEGEDEQDALVATARLSRLLDDLEHDGRATSDATTDATSDQGHDPES